MALILLSFISFSFLSIFPHVQSAVLENTEATVSFNHNHNQTNDSAVEITPQSDYEDDEDYDQEDIVNLNTVEEWERENLAGFRSGMGATSNNDTDSVLDANHAENKSLEQLNTTGENSHLVGKKKNPGLAHLESPLFYGIRDANHAENKSLEQLNTMGENSHLVGKKKNPGLGHLESPLFYGIRDANHAENKSLEKVNTTGENSHIVDKKNSELELLKSPLFYGIRDDVLQGHTLEQRNRLELPFANDSDNLKHLQLKYEGNETVCGNGRVDKGEECDCGSAEACKDKDSCCVPPGEKHSCKYGRFRGFECDRLEPCCSKECKIISADEKVKCSEGNENCSHSYCDGKSSHCPNSLTSNLCPEKNVTRENVRLCSGAPCSDTICGEYGLADCNCTVKGKCQICCKDEHHVCQPADRLGLPVAMVNILSTRKHCHVEVHDTKQMEQNHDTKPSAPQKFLLLSISLWSVLWRTLIIGNIET